MNYLGGRVLPLLIGSRFAAHTNHRHLPSNRRPSSACRDALTQMPVAIAVTNDRSCVARKRSFEPGARRVSDPDRGAISLKGPNAHD